MVAAAAVVLIRSLGALQALGPIETKPIRPLPPSVGAAYTFSKKFSPLTVYKQGGSSIIQKNLDTPQKEGG